MIAATIAFQSALRSGNGTCYLLILDAHGNPFALAPVEHLSPDPFPTAQIRALDGDRQVLASGSTKAALPTREFDASSLWQVESALKRLHDATFLCDHVLARSPLVTARLKSRATMLDRAKMVRALLEQTVAQLRPNGPAPTRSQTPRREWHPYLILHHAYIEGEHNYAIMNWLQISEGTFNRTRRRALETVARVLWEMEQ